MNRVRGSILESLVASALGSSGADVQRQITFRGSRGFFSRRSRIDFGFRANGGIDLSSLGFTNFSLPEAGFLEVKLGGSKLRGPQRSVFPRIVNGSAVPRGGNADDFRLETGMPLRNSRGFGNSNFVAILTCGG